MSSAMNYTLFFDGGARGNPGIAGSGAALFDKHGVEVDCCWHDCGADKTNNFAEYTGLIKGVEMLIKNKLDFSTVTIKGDSMLVIKQCKGEFKISNPGLKQLYAELKALVEGVVGVKGVSVSSHFKSFEHVPRADNKRADQLSNIAMNVGPMT